MNLPVLMYHDVVDAGRPDQSGFPGAAAAHYKLDEASFLTHLELLASSGLRFPSVLCPDLNEARTCLLTFDDGGESAIRVAEQLERRGMVGHFFITTQRIGSPGFVTGLQLRRLHQAGHVVGSHSHTHPADISALDHAALAAQWVESRDRLQQLLGEEIRVASVPGGFYTRRVAQVVAAAGFRQLFTSEPTVHTHQVDDCRVLGRYAIWRDTPAADALALATGDGPQRQRQWLSWNLKKPLKRWSRPLYQWVRRRRLGER